MPALKDDPSDRRATGQLSSLQPVLGLRLSIEARRRFRDPVQRQNEIKKPLEQFALCDHLTMFGRPLWRIHWDSGYIDLKTFVTRKLLSGPQAKTSNADHVFAILASRLCLDPNSHFDASVADLVFSTGSRHRGGPAGGW